MNFLDNKIIGLKVRYLLITIIIFVVILFFMIFIINNLFNGQVVITTNKNATIFELTTSNKGYIKKNIGKNKVSLSIQPGTYTYLVEEGDKSTIQTVKVERSKKNEFIIKPEDLKKVNNLNSVNANSLQVFNSSINYLNSSYNYLETIKFGQKVPSNYPIPQATNNIKSIEWSAKNKGVMNYNDGYVFINGSSATPLKLSPSQGSRVANKLDFNSLFNVISYDINNKDQIISFVGENLYYKSSPTAEAEILVENLRGDYTNTAISNSSLYAYSSTIDIVDEDEAKTREAIDFDKNIYVAKLNDKNNKTKINSNSVTNWLGFSPEGKKLAYLNAEGLHIYNLESKQDTLLYARQLPNPSTTYWVDENNLIYVDIDGLWIMDVQDKRANKLAGGNELKYIQSVTTSITNNKQLFYSLTIPNPRGSKGSVNFIEL